MLINVFCIEGIEVVLLPSFGPSEEPLLDPLHLLLRPSPFLRSHTSHEVILCLASLLAFPTTCTRYPTPATSAPILRVQRILKAQPVLSMGVVLNSLVLYKAHVLLLDGAPLASLETLLDVE